MPSYVKFRDVAEVMLAGGEMEAAGNLLKSNAEQKIENLKNRETAVLGRKDSYSTDFWKQAYAAKDRHTEIYTEATDLATKISLIGTDVVKAARQIVWSDAVNGAAMTQT
jgi:hypothetical protein